MITALVFLVVGGIFVGTLLKNIMTLISSDMNKDEFSGKKIFYIFRIPLICFAIMMIYVLFLLPYLNENGYY